MGDVELDIECTFCLGRMQIEDRGGVEWLVCPNGCPTEMEAPARKPALDEDATRPAIRAGTAGAA